jgi:hypothetical protein
MLRAPSSFRVRACGRCRRSPSGRFEKVRPNSVVLVRRVALGYVPGNASVLRNLDGLLELRDELLAEKRRGGLFGCRAAFLSSVVSSFLRHQLWSPKAPLNYRKHASDRLCAQDAAAEVPQLWNGLEEPLVIMLCRSHLIGEPRRVRLLHSA